MDIATRVIAIRHGQTAWNVEGRMQGSLDVPLDETGRWQAARLAEALVDAGIDAIVSSDLTRAFETASLVAAKLDLPLTTDVGLRERGFGIFEGHTFAEIDQRWPAEADRWRHRDPDFEPEGGESLTRFHARVIGACSRLAAAHPDQTLAIVAHGGILDSLYRAATHTDLHTHRSWELGNASINRLLYSAQGFTLVGWDDVAHLDLGPLDESADGVVKARSGTVGVVEPGAK
jgi:probable phosphoglycerate mutase